MDFSDIKYKSQKAEVIKIIEKYRSEPCISEEQRNQIHYILSGEKFICVADKPVWNGDETSQTIVTSAFLDILMDINDMKGLDLSWTQINVLPESIKNLSSLNELNLSNTQITELPEGFSKLNSLMSLELGGTQIIKLPEVVTTLSSLQNLKLYKTKISELPENIANLRGLQSLDLGSSQIRKLPDSISNLSNLKSLNLSNTQIIELPDNIRKLNNLQSLDLGDTKICELPENITNLSGLQELKLYFTQISDLPESVSRLCCLEKLDLSGTKISVLPEVVPKLSCLKTLDINRTQISELPEEIVRLYNLQNLNVSSTKISNLPERITELRNLQRLDLSNLEIEELPESISKLTNLHYLNLGGTPIRELTECFFKLDNLESLQLYWTQISELPECISELENLQNLNLGSSKIKGLPKGISKISNLQILNLSGTQISELPEDISKLRSLQELDLSSTSIISLPENLSGLSSLQVLNLNSTRISELPKSLSKLGSLKSLNLYGTQINKLPEDISKLKSLKELDLCNTPIISLPKDISGLSNLQNLNLSSTQISELPESIGGLTGLQHLNVSNTQLATLPESLRNLTGLQSLIVSNTQLTTLPESIGSLSRLKYLSISNTQLTRLPENIGNLIGIQRLYIHSTKLISLPESIGKLTRLKYLDVSNTQLITLPESIGNLTELQKLDASNTRLTMLPKSIGNIIELKFLDISNTQVTSLPESICNLTELQSLDVSNTQLRELPKRIGELRNLTFLDISRTYVQSIDNELWKVSSIQTLSLEDLSLNRMPKDILKTNLDFVTQKRQLIKDRNTKGIYIHNLSLSKQPISLFYQKRNLIEQYFNEEKVYVNSAKIIFLGDGEVGKTYTLKRLLNHGKKATEEHPYLTQTTHGVLIKPYHVNDGGEQYDIRLWDFGGQQIMHSMHRCFLTERSCYIVMLSTRTDRDLLGQARYWLRTVTSFAPHAPVIVLVNQWTKNLIRIDEYRLREEFKNIKEFLYFSVVEAEDKEFLTLKESIMGQVRQLDCYGMEFPKSWYRLMLDLEKESESNYYIPKSTYYRMCFERGLRYEDNGEEGIYDWLLDWFNDLGICFSYNKNSNSQRLGDYQLLNPQWLTRAAYVLINNGESTADNGILTKEQIEAVLTDTEPLDFDDLGSVSYKPNEIEYVLEILRKFQISYQLRDSKELIPVLCNENSSGSARPEWFIPGEMQHTSYEFQYEYLPDTIIHRLMIFCHQSHYAVRDRWRKGMRVDFSGENSKLTAVIDSGNENPSIAIDFYSYGCIPCWEFLSKLREEILQINTQLSLIAKDFINMETDGIKDRFSVEAVLKSRLRGKIEYPASNFDGDYLISDILGSAYGQAYAAIIEKIIEIRKGDIKDTNIGDILNQIFAFLDELNNPKIGAILQAIIKALQAMQGNKLYYRDKGNSNNLEDYRNRFVSDYLRAAGYICNDQQPGGTGAAGKKPGERDFVVRDENESEFLIYEGLNLTSINNTKSDEHLEKLLNNYNPMGLQFGILTTYLECNRDKFKRFTDSYKEHISKYAPKSYICSGEPKDIPSNGHFLACMEMKYETGGLDFYIYHIIVRIAP